MAHPDCPALAIMQISMEEGSKRVRERDAWARGVFPAVYERLRKAAAALPAGTVAQPFVDTLSELVQADDTLLHGAKSCSLIPPGDTRGEVVYGHNGAGSAWPVHRMPTSKA